MPVYFILNAFDLFSSNLLWNNAWILLRNATCASWCFQFSSFQLLSHVRLFATPWSQHARPPCPLPTPGVHSDSRPSSQWCHPAISSSVVLFSFCPQSLLASESFPVSQLFAWGGQRCYRMVIWEVYTLPVDESSCLHRRSGPRVPC